MNIHFHKYELLGIVFALCAMTTIDAQPLQELELQHAYDLFEERYPALKDAMVLQDIHALELDRIDKNDLPSIYWKSEGRLQSESGQLDPGEGVMLPFEIDLPLYSVKTYLEAQYLIIDGNITDVQKMIKDIELQADLQKIELDRFALRERINGLCTGILLLREQDRLFDISLGNLASRRDLVAAGVEYGTALESELKRIDVKSLELEAQKQNVLFRINGLVSTLSDLIGQEVANDVDIILPSLNDPLNIPEINRPEYKLFSLQQESILARADLIDARLSPKLSAFAQTGVGYPNPVNFLDDNIAPYGILGMQFTWQITDWKKGEMDKELLKLQTLRLKNAEETFEFNLNSREASYVSEVERIRDQIDHENRIAILQKEILDQLVIQFDEGVITSAEYINQVNAELRARQQLAVHQAQLLNLQLEFWNERGAF